MPERSAPGSGSDDDDVVMLVICHAGLPVECGAQSPRWAAGPRRCPCPGEGVVTRAG
jgi:hypothetical protein